MNGASWTLTLESRGEVARIRTGVRSQAQAQLRWDVGAWIYVWEVAEMAGEKYIVGTYVC